MMMLLAVFLSFVVVDGEGRPVEGAEVGHTTARTGKDGHVALETDAPRIVIRKQGYQAAVVKPREVRPGARVVMRGAGVAGSCAAVFPARREAVPAAELVRASENYSEKAVWLNGVWSVDARGVMPDGTHWREMGNREGVFSYRDVTAEKGAELDSAVERMCQPRFSARVVDEQGLRLAGVRVTAPALASESDSEGELRGATAGLWLVFRKYGYRSVVVKPAEGLQIVMERLAAAPFPRCADSNGRMFRLPGGGEGFHDVDYSGNLHTVKTLTGKHYLQHGHGPSWSLGYPQQYDVQRSIRYEEKTYEGRADITAARGEFADGTRWRFLGTFGETISYETKDAEAALRFDAMMDGVCLGR